MFNNFLETKSTASIARELNAMGLKNRNGLLWDKRRIEYILKNPIYTGQLKWNEKLFDSIHQPLVSKEIFNKTEDIFEENKYRSPRSKIGGILKGFLYCGYCNNPFTSNYTKKKDKLYYFYRCKSTLTPQNCKRYHCDSSYYNMQEVEKKVYEKILWCSTEESLLAVKHELDHNNRTIEKDINSLNAELKLQEGKLESTKTKKEKYLDSLITRELKKNERKMVNEKIEEFSLEEKQLKTNIYRLQFDISSKSQSIQTIDQFKEELIFFKYNYSELSTTEMHQWLKRNIETITYSDKEVNIRFRLLKVVR
jgi:site-specific DNA recombinase